MRDPLLRLLAGLALVAAGFLAGALVLWAGPSFDPETPAVAPEVEA